MTRWIVFFNMDVYTNTKLQNVSACSFLLSILYPCIVKIFKEVKFATKEG